MFLKALYQYHKGIFCLFVGFVCAFLFLNYKWGMVATPIYQYGMFSGQQDLKDSFSLLQVHINGAPVNMSKYHFVEKDYMLVMPKKYLSAAVQNEQVQATMHSFFAKFGWGSSVRTTSDTVADTTIFMKWYQQQLEKFMPTPIRTIQITQQQYLWNGQHAVAQATPQNQLILAYP